MHDNAPARPHIRPASWPAMLLARWWVLLGGALLGLVVGGAIASRAPTQYVAEALIAPSRTWTQVQFEPSIQTVDDNTAKHIGAATTTPERRQALADLVSSTEVEQRAMQAANEAGVAQTLPSPPLGAHVRGTLKPHSELVAIDAVASTSEQAVQLADIWAKAYVDVVNSIYVPAASTQSLAQVQEQASNDLQKAQDALTASLRDGRLESLTWQINDDKQLLSLLSTPYEVPAAFTESNSNSASRQSETSGAVAATPTSGGSGSEQSQDVNSSGGAPQSTISGGSSSASVVPQVIQPSGSPANDYRLAERRTLDDVAQVLRHLDATRASVRALIDQGTSGNNANDASAIALIKTQLVAISGGIPSDIQLQIPSAASGDSQSDLQSLAASIDQARAQVAADFDQRRQAYEQHRAQQIATIEDELRSLKAEREQADAERNALTTQRDIASDAYQALARKTQELQVAQGTQGTEVELASTATAASTVGTSPSIPMALGMLVGLIIVTAIVLTLAILRTAREIATPLPRVTQAPLTPAPREPVAKGDRIRRRAAS